MTKALNFKNKIKNGRDLAIQVVYLCEQEDMYSHVAWSQSVYGRDYDQREKKFAMELALGTLRRKATLDYVIQRYSKRKTADIDPLTLNVLRTALYQMYFMGSVPKHSAVDEAVNSCKCLGNSKASGFVNAVLRKASAIDLEAELDSLSFDEATNMSIRHSYPKWIVERWIETLGADGAEMMCVAQNKQPCVSARLNLLRGDVDEVSKVLKDEGLTVHPGNYLPEAVVLEDVNPIEEYESFRSGHFTVQDESSMLVAHVLGAKPSWKVADVCSAPGGKATHIAELMEDRGFVLACDVNARRVQMVRDVVDRLKLESVKVEQCDAREISEKYDCDFDAVLVDAPCSGLGVLSRRADSRWRKQLQDVAELSQIQYDILESVCRLVKSGGVLVYSTCTVERAENQDLIGKFLSKHPEFRPYPVKRILNDISPHFSYLDDDQFFVQLLPYKDHVDGFFICKMEKL